MKKLLALVISLMMALTLLVPAFAADNRVGPGDSQTPPDSLSVSDNDLNNHDSVPHSTPTPIPNPPKTYPVVETVPNLYLDSTQYLRNDDDGLCATTLEAGKVYLVENEFWLISKDGKGSLTDARVRMNDMMRGSDGVDYVTGPIYTPLIIAFSDEVQINMSGGISAILQSGQTAKFHYVKDSAELVVKNLPCPEFPLADDELFSDSGAKIGNTGADGKLAANKSCMIRFRIMVESVSEPIAPPVNTPATESDPYAQPNKEPRVTTTSPLIGGARDDQPADPEFQAPNVQKWKQYTATVDRLDRAQGWNAILHTTLSISCIGILIYVILLNKRVREMADYIADMERDTFEPATQDDEPAKHSQRRYGDFFKHGSGDDDGDDIP